MGLRDWTGVFGGLAVLLLSVALAAWVLQAEPTASPGTPSASPVAAARVSPNSSALARDPEALHLAERSRDVLVSLVARPGGPVELVALPSDGKPLAPGSLRATVESETTRVVEPTPCGRNCFRLEERVLSGSSVGLSIEVSRFGRPAAAVTFRLPARLPPSGASLLRKVSGVWNRLRTLQIHETLTSGQGFVIRTDYRLESPDRLSLETSQGQRTLLIGKSRWDLESGRWVRSAFPGVRVPIALWDGAGQARDLGRARVGAVPVRVLALFNPDPDFPAWFRLFVARDGRVLEAEMLARGHFMTDYYSGFDEPVTIEPPAP